MKILLLIIFIFSAHAQYNQTSLKAGFNTGVVRLQTFENTKDTTFAIGFNTHFGYRFNQLEINASSYINIAKFDNTYHQIGSDEFDAKGTFRSFSVGPQFKYFRSTPIHNNVWYPYISLAPIIGLQTYKFDIISNRQGSYNYGHKLTYDSYGAMLGLGGEELLIKKERPVYFEIVYLWMKARKMTEVGGSSTKVLSLRDEKIDEDLQEHTVILSMGLTFF